MEKFILKDLQEYRGLIRYCIKLDHTATPDALSKRLEMPSGVTTLYKNQLLTIPKILPLPEKVSLYPNPNNGSFTVTVQDIQQGLSFEIYNILGQKIYTASLNDGDNNISFLYEQHGLYLYKIIKSDGTVMSLGKFVVMGK